MIRFVLAVAAAAFVTLPAAYASAASSATPTTVSVTIFGHPYPAVPGKIVFAPKTVKRGPMILKITNTDQEWHLFQIDGVRSRLIGPNGGRAIIRFTFHKAGLYFASCPDDKDVNFAGALGVT